jgi:hypothetical protein
LSGIIDAVDDTDDLRMGVSRSLLAGDWEWPIHGLRHKPEAGTSGWYCWTGELSDAPDFFVPYISATSLRAFQSWSSTSGCRHGPGSFSRPTTWTCGKIRRFFRSECEPTMHAAI